jgi:hypothetical protein
MAKADQVQSVLNDHLRNLFQILISEHQFLSLRMKTAEFCVFNLFVC